MPRTSVGRLGKRGLWWKPYCLVSSFPRFRAEVNLPFLDIAKRNTSRDDLVTSPREKVYGEVTVSMAGNQLK